MLSIKTVWWLQHIVRQFQSTHPFSWQDIVVWRSYIIVVHHRVQSHIQNSLLGLLVFNRVLLAWVTVDGALFQPVTAAETEDWVDLQPDLDAVVTNLKQDRLASGLSLAEAAPVAHATDSFRKQRLLLDAFYKNKYPKEQEVEACLQPSYAEICCMTSWRYSAR